MRSNIFLKEETASYTYNLLLPTVEMLHTLTGAVSRQADNFIKKLIIVVLGGEMIERKTGANGNRVRLLPLNLTGLSYSGETLP